MYLKSALPFFTIVLLHLSTFNCEVLVTCRSNSFCDARSDYTETIADDNARPICCDRGFLAYTIDGGEGCRECVDPTNTDAPTIPSPTTEAQTTTAATSASVPTTTSSGTTAAPTTATNAVGADNSETAQGSACQAGCIAGIVVGVVILTAVVAGTIGLIAFLLRSRGTDSLP